MGKNQGNGKKPVDMSRDTAPEKKKEYRPHPESITAIDNLDLGCFILRQEISKYPGSLIIWFVIQVFYKDGEEILEISRFDCHHDSIHQHLLDFKIIDGRLYPKSQNLKRKDPIYKIAKEESPWNTINGYYYQCQEESLILIDTIKESMGVV